jgi:hypothetical protein
LFLIQNSQETEEALEELRQKLEETKGKMTAETGTLSSQIQSLQVAAARCLTLDYVLLAVYARLCRQASSSS